MMDRAALEQRADRAAQIWRTKSNAEDLGTFLADFAEREMSLAGTPAQVVALRPLPGELALIQIAMETLRHIATYSPVSRIQPVMITRDAMKKIEALTFESEPVAALVTPPQAVPQRQRYVAELSLNGRYVWCIVEAIPRVENVVEEFGCGPDAQKAAYDKLQAGDALSRPERSPK